MEKKKKSKGEYLILILIIGLINFGLFAIQHITTDIYDIFEPHFIIYWGVILILSFIAGFFYLIVWIVINSYFNIIEVD